VGKLFESYYLKEELEMEFDALGEEA